ncbi:hypothetical protein [Streptomyces flaveolus]|uniref:hypothetical protein n=1 Tax=Streptomyces flaveolus TaxID=67297 RepID=UPI0033E5FA9F
MEQRTHTPPQPPTLREPLWGPAAIRLRDELRALLAHDSAAAPWPDGVIARYLTVAGAIVDVTGEDHDVDGICHGCEGTPGKSGYVSRSLDVTRTWAQRHAETCRALPRPAVSR